jgi:hypothetical protein
MNVSPLDGETDLVSMMVMLNGHAMPDDYVVESIHVTRELNRLGTARIVLADGDPSAGGFKLSTADTLLPGVKVEVRMGYHQNTSTVFKGVIVRHGVRMDRQGRSQLVLLVDDTEVAIGAPVQADNSCGLLLTYGDSLIAFDAEMDARNQLNSLSASDDEVPGVSVRGTVSFQGNALAVPGKTIALAGLGGYFDGDVYISRVEHTLAQGNWVTEVTFGLPPRCVASDNAQVHARAVLGLQIGTVLQIEAAPQGQLRVRVSLPMLDAEDKDVWARLGTPYATDQGGLFCMPELNDEVVVGFLGNDPRFPVVLGAPYSSTREFIKAQNVPNTVEGIATKGGLTVLPEDARKITAISTPGGHTPGLDDDGQSNTITDSDAKMVAMSKEGVVQCSKTRLPLSADGDSEITAARALEAELAWLDAVIAASMAHHFQRADAACMLEPPTLPAHAPYALALRKWGLSAEERLVLILALAPHVRPQALDSFLIRNASLDLPFSEFGGQGGGHRGFWPTAETASFLLAGDRMAARVATQRLFGAGAPLRRLGLLAWDEWPADGAAPRALLGHPLKLGRNALSLLVTGESCQPDFDGGFPARRLSTSLDWDQLVLAPHLQDQVDEIRAWIEHRDTLLRGWGLARRIKPGFRSLFYGPPGTGKSLTAALLGKQSGLPVYRIDLSMVVSKYAGETEKNLARVFEQAEQQDWILFFDEADALFGKRSGGSSANGRYANEDAARLLQRIEDFPGLAILAANLNGNIDEACAQRFQSMLYFPMPDRAERLRLWQDAFAPPCRLAPDCALDALADEFELSGGAIINVLRYAALACLRRGSEEIGMDDVRQGVRRELCKDACLPLLEKR